jgi:hypothetical protein
VSGVLLLMGEFQFDNKKCKGTEAQVGEGRFAIVVVTNQAGLPVKGREEKWKRKIPMIAESAVRSSLFLLLGCLIWCV